ncbi:MAG: beta-N-acetylhexosaminidase [Prevotellaceae bacterium]|nr:beta-N-acetylhexosaminidase [Prevotellaceae bacterium]
MKNKLLLFAVLALVNASVAVAQRSINLTPHAKSVTELRSDEYLDLPSAFTVCTGAMPDSVVDEVLKFAAVLKVSANIDVALSADDETALLRLEKPSEAQSLSMGSEGYRLVVKADGVTISANTAAGYFYAFQTIKKVLPSNVMAGVADTSVTAYRLPLMTIDDSPRFRYRGFMLDVSRHFFDVAQIKRMLDVMACYKLNRFHWHLTDDQGWRAEIKKYPKLTTVGATAPNTLRNTFDNGEYWTNEPYGPYYYTQDEMREVVAYAKKLHIEVIPEIEMPGHFAAAATAYPEFSCSPNGSHSVWSNGGISTDAINVANPAAVQFSKDVLAELIEIFPYEYIHIGGDECPTSAWENNAECQALYKKLGLTSYRQLQNIFNKEINDFISEKGRRLIVWNEAITASGADTQLMSELGVTVMSWSPAVAGARKAAELGLDNIFTPYGPYYINRVQSTNPGEPVGAGNGADNVQSTYSQEPIPSDISAAMAAHYTGVQGTFWCEHVDDPSMLEYLALPRLIAIAETGWTPRENKNFEDFCVRISADSVMLNYNGYNYGRHYMINAETVEKVMPVAGEYYRLETRASGERAGRCIELLSENSPLLSTYSDKGAAAGRLWTNARAAEGSADEDRQMWKFEEDVNRPGYYAMVCKAAPDGSVSGSPSAQSTAGRWSYDEQNKHYVFRLGTHDAGYGQAGSDYYYSIQSENAPGGYLNASLGGQGYAVNYYANPADGNSGLWTFVGKAVESDMPVYDAFTPLEVGRTYRISNSVDKFAGSSLTDTGSGDLLRHSSDRWTADAWTVTSSTVNADNSQIVQLRNAVTGRNIAANGTSFSARLGYTAHVGTTPADVELIYSKSTDDFTLRAGGASGKKLFPLPSGAVNAGNTINADADAIRQQGAAWNISEVHLVTYVCTDEQGASLGTFVGSEPAGRPFTASAPELKNFSPVSYNGTDEPTALSSLDEDVTVQVVYRRAAYSLTVESRDQRGALIARDEQAVPVGETFSFAHPEHAYYTFESADVEDGATLALEADKTVTVRYTTTAYCGVKALTAAVTEVSGGCSYVLFDACTTDASRQGYRRVVPSTGLVNRFTSIDDADPTAVWTLETYSTRFRIRNDYTDLYVPLLQNSAQTFLASKVNSGSFAFTLNADGETWKIKGTNDRCWDGTGNGDLVGWNDPGHPIRIYEFIAQPYFSVEVIEETIAGQTLATSTALVKAGEPYTLRLTQRENYVVSRIEGAEALDAVADHLTVHVIYDDLTGIGSVAAGDEAAAGVYDLSGRRLGGISGRGVYIVDGRKVIVR